MFHLHVQKYADLIAYWNQVGGHGTLDTSQLVVKRTKTAYPKSATIYYYCVALAFGD